MCNECEVNAGAYPGHRNAGAGVWMVCAPTSCPPLPQQPLLTQLPDATSKDAIITCYSHHKLDDAFHLHCWSKCGA